MRNRPRFSARLRRLCHPVVVAVFAWCWAGATHAQDQPTAASPITNGLVVYLNFDNNLSAAGGTSVNGAVYRSGSGQPPRFVSAVIGQGVSFANTPTSGQPDDWAVVLGHLESVYSNDFSVSLWERTSTSGDGALIGNKDWSVGTNIGWVISSLEAKNVNWNTLGGTRRDIGLNPPFSDGQWHLVTVTFDRSANQVTCYMDGVPANTSSIGASGFSSLNGGLNTLVGSSGNGSYSASGDLDDLGIWARVLTPGEVASIYGAGLQGRPLVSVFSGVAPTILTNPVNATVTAGRSASFSVAASGPGPFTFQWRLNGTNLARATNATLSIPSVSLANQGIYTVMVGNGSGAVISTGAQLTVYELSATGQWDFDFSDLRATVGADLEDLNGPDLTASFLAADLGGRTARVLNLAAGSSGEGFYLRHRAKPNGGGNFVNQYTLLLDVMLAPWNGPWTFPIFQMDPFNPQSGGPAFYLGAEGVLSNEAGLGADGQSHGSLDPGLWYRIAFAVDLTAPAGQQLTKYLNGAKVGSQSLTGGFDGGFALGPTARLFAASSNSGSFRPAILVNSVQFINSWLPPEAIGAFGSPAAEGLPPGDNAILVTIDNSSVPLTLRWTGPTGQYQVEQTASLSAPSWRPLGALGTNRTLQLPPGALVSYYRVSSPAPEIAVGQLPQGEQSVPTKQILHAAGQQLQFSGRPVDLVLSPDGRSVYVKNINNLLVVDAGSWRLRQTLTYPGSGASLHGIAVSPDGSHVYVTGAGTELYDWTVGSSGTLAFSRTVNSGGSDPCGLAISTDGTKAYVCLSINNQLAVVSLSGGGPTKRIKVGIAPWDVVLSPDGNTAYVSDWGGRFPANGDLTAPSAGTPVVVDDRGVGASGAVSFVDLAIGVERTQVATGLHPSDIELSADGATLFVANANSDTVSVVDTTTEAVRETILVRPDPTFSYGSAADGLALSRDGKTLFVAAAGNNAIAFVELPTVTHTNSIVRGFLPTDWYPGAVVADAQNLYVANVKGLGTRYGQPTVTSWQIGAHLGTANKIPFPSSDALSKYTAQVFENGRIQEIKDSQTPPDSAPKPVPVPKHVGEPSVFQHVLYILKENKTYDQVLGDLPQGNGNASLCIYPRFVSPNHHALAEQYVLLDNYYCNGVNSADGHSWATEGNNTDHLEKSFGGFSRSATFGDDPLTYSSTGFIWNNVLRHGLTFRNYGEMDYASTSPSASWSQIYTDFLSHKGAIRYVQNIGIKSLLPYSSTNVPGWNLGIPDVVRADGFIKELSAAQAAGIWASFHLLYISNDHTGGPPSPRAQVADNDLALGRVVDAVTHSIFASNTVIIVNEDDPQSGYDHVDAHRSLCLVISPYTKRGKVISTFYNQAGALHTMEQILGLPPMNQLDAMAPLMFECFTGTPDFAPFTALTNNVPLTEGTIASANPTRKERYWAKRIRKMDFSHPDRINEDVFNRYIWFTIKGNARYPSEFVGGHGKGLKQLGLLLDKNARDNDD